MAALQGSNSYLKIIKETVYGDGTTPTVSIPIKATTLKPTTIMKPRGSELAASRFAPKPFAGAEWTPGGWVMNAYPELLGYILTAMYGAPSVVQVDTGVYDNTFEPSIAVGKSLSLEQSLGGANPLLIPGYQVDQAIFNQGITDEAQMLTLGIEGGGQMGVEGSLTTFTPPTTTPFQFDEAVLTADGSTIYVDSLTWTDSNGLVLPNHKISAGKEMRQSPFNGNFTTIGEFIADFENLSNFDKYRAATDVALIATYTSAGVITGAYVYSLTVTWPAVKYLNPLPDISSPEIVKQTVGFEGHAGDVNGSTVPVSITLRSGIDYSA